MVKFCYFCNVIYKQQYFTNKNYENQTFFPTIFGSWFAVGMCIDGFL